VTGDGVDKPGNFLVRFGTPIGSLLAAAGLRPQAKKLILGGPMMGLAQRGPNVSVVKGTSGVLVLCDAAAHEAGPCIRCGRCVRACPYGLMPAAISRAAERLNVDAAIEWNLLECKECGCCTYVCPARRPIVHQVKFAKAEAAKWKRRAAEKEKAEAAKT
jgi:electron transport complex protein RnfC